MKRTISIELNGRRTRRKNTASLVTVAVILVIVVSAIGIVVVNVYGSTSGAARVVRDRDHRDEGASERALQMMGSRFAREDTAAPYGEEDDDENDGDMNGRREGDIAPRPTPTPLIPCEYGGTAIYSSSSTTAKGGGASRKCSLGVKYGGEAVVETTNLVSASLVNLSRRRIIDDWRRAAGILSTVRHEQGMNDISTDLLKSSIYSAGLVKSWMFSGYGPLRITTCFWEQHKLFYIHIYKGGNNMLRANMISPLTRARRRRSRIRAEEKEKKTSIIRTADQMQHFLDLGQKKGNVPSKVKEEKEDVDRDTECRQVAEFDPFTTLDPDTCIITFVRHPFDHFISGYNEAEHRWKDLRTRFASRKNKVQNDKERLIKAKEKILERQATRHAIKRPNGASPSSLSRTEPKPSKLWSFEQKTISDSGEGKGGPRTEDEATSSPQTDGSSTLIAEGNIQGLNRTTDSSRAQSSTERRRLYAIAKTENEATHPDGFDPFDGHGLGTEERALAFLAAVLELKWMADPLTYKNARDPVDPKHGDRPPLFHPYKSLLWGPMIEQSDWNFNVAFAHVLPQSSAVTRLRPDFVGHLESLEADWKMMQKVCNVTVGELSQEKGQHETSKDPEGSARAMRNLIETNTHVQLVLCLIYKHDFLIFGYSFPPACSILFENIGD